MENENNQDPSINSPHPAVAGSGQASEPEPINSLDPLQPTDANALAGKQGGGTSPIPEPISTPPNPPIAEPINLPNPPLEGGQNPPSPLYPASAEALADKQGGETAPSPIKNLLLKAKEVIQFRKRKKLEKILGLARQKTAANAAAGAGQAGQGKITNNDVQKLLRVSDATATRYLSQLVKEGKLRRVGTPERAQYELL